MEQRSFAPINFCAWRQRALRIQSAKAVCLGTGVYRRPKPLAEAEGFNPLASASVAEVLWPKVWPKVNV